MGVVKRCAGVTRVCGGRVALQRRRADASDLRCEGCMGSESQTEAAVHTQWQAELAVTGSLEQTTW